MWRKVARAGWVARGVSYSIAGLLALSLVRGSRVGSLDADQQGALEAVSDATGGAVGTMLLAGLAVGLALFAFWQGAQLPQLEGSDLDTWLERIAKVIGVLFYGSLALTAGRLVFSGGSADTDSRWSVERLVSWILQHSLGRIAVAIAAVVVAGIAARRGSRTVTGDLDDDLRLSDAGDRERRLVEILGRVGEVGRAVSFLIIAWFLLQAAWTNSAAEAGGLDASLVRAAGSTIGAVLVAMTGVGFVLFGSYSALSAPHRRLDFDDAD